MRGDAEVRKDWGGFEVRGVWDCEGEEGGMR